MALTIHVGAHKTASTHTQQTLRGLWPRMTAAGIMYLDMRALRRPGHRLDSSLENGPAAARRRSPWRRRMDQASEIWPHILLSEENTLGSIRREGLMGPEGVYPNAVRRMDRLCAIMRRRPAVLFMGVREPLSFLTSAFSMEVQGGHELDFGEYTAGFDPAALSWSGLAERLLSVRGVAQVVVWRHEDHAAVRGAVLRAMLPDAVARHADDPPPAVVGLSQAAYDEILRRFAADADGDPVTIAREAKTLFPRGGDARPLSVADAATRDRCRESYREDIDRLSRIDGVTLLRP